MHPLTADSPRRPMAAEFGHLLDRRMRQRKVGAKVLGPAAKVAISAIGEYRRGFNLPSLQAAARLADSLDEPRLLEIARRGRTKECPACRRTFVAQHGRQVYCSITCRGQGRPAEAAPVERGVMLLRGELLRMGPPRKQAIGRALTLLDDVLGPGRAAADALGVHQRAVAAMCGSCEPLGLCRQSTCELRPVSPLPLGADGNRAVETARPAPGRWAHPGARERFSDELRRRWAEPGRREQQSERTRARWATLNDEERAELTQKMARRPGTLPPAGGGRHRET